MRPVPGLQAKRRSQVSLEVVVELDRAVDGLLRGDELGGDGLLGRLCGLVGGGEKLLSLALLRDPLLGLVLGGLERRVVELGGVDPGDVDGRRRADDVRGVDAAERDAVDGEGPRHEQEPRRQVLDDDGALALEPAREEDDDASRGDGGAELGRGGDGAAREGLGGVLGRVEARGLRGKGFEVWGTSGGRGDGE